MHVSPRTTTGTINIMNRFATLILSLLIASTTFADKPTVLKLWPSTPPGDEDVKLGEEKDFTKDTDRLIAGRRIIKLGKCHLAGDSHLQTREGKGHRHVGRHLPRRRASHSRVGP